MSDRPSGWAVGFTVFAGVMLVTMGILHALWGLVALFNDEFFVVGANYTFKFDATAWGWIHLIAGIIAIFAGVSLFAGRTWARVVGVAVAVAGDGQRSYRRNSLHRPHNVCACLRESAVAHAA